MANRVVVTGMGAITPLGNSVETFWEGLKKGKAATAPITKFESVWNLSLTMHWQQLRKQSSRQASTWRRKIPTE